MRRGATLVEVMIGVMLFGTLFYGIVSMFPICLSSLRKGQRNAVCLNLARHTLERRVAHSFSSLTNGAQSVIVDAAGNPLPSPLPGGVDAYTIAVTVSDPQPPDANIKQVDVQVSTPGTGPSDAGSARQTTWVYNYADPW